MEAGEAPDPFPGSNNGALSLDAFALTARSQRLDVPPGLTGERRIPRLSGYGIVELSVPAIVPVVKLEHARCFFVKGTHPMFVSKALDVFLKSGGVEFEAILFKDANGKLR